MKHNLQDIKEIAKQYLRYDAETGYFYWINEPCSRGPRKVGTIAGGLNIDGYWQIRLNRVFYYGHRLAWLLTYDYWPKEIDHINGDPSDNRLCNLRECRHSQNIAARNRYACGYELHGPKYRARIDVNGIRHELGSFDNPIEATAAYKAARYRLLGEFA